MNWTYSIQHKTTASLMLAVVLVLILFNNLSERSNSTRLNKAIAAMYKDRLLAESYIFKYADNLRQITETIDNPHYALHTKQQHIAAQESEILELHRTYAQTYLTQSEARYFKQLTHTCTAIGILTATGQLDQVKQKTKAATALLHQLSAIQVSEATLQMTKINRIFSSGVLHSKFEIAMLIVIGVIIQALVFASKSLHTQTIPPGSNLN